MTVRKSKEFPSVSLSTALERSLKNAKGLDASMSATVQSARVLAASIDAAGSEVKAAPSLAFLQYCRSLGLTVEDKPSKDDDKKGETRKLSPMEQFRARYSK